MNALRRLPADVQVLIVARGVRLFAYGMLSVVLVLYLTTLGLGDTQIGTLLALTLLGDLVISLAITATADRLGRRRMLLLGAALVVVAGGVFAVTSVLPILTIAAIVGTISPSGHEVGPFLAIEQAILPQLMPDDQRTAIFAWFTLLGSWATAFGALAGGLIAQLLQQQGLTPRASYQAVVLGYAALGVVLAVCAARLSPAVEVAASARSPRGAGGPRAWRLGGLPQSGPIVVRLALLFSLDAFAGGLIIQSLLAAWFHRRFGLSPAALGTLLLATNLLAGASALVAARLARRIGLLNTMVWTHLPSNILLMLVPLMPTLPLAVGLVLVRWSISQMDVPTRQSYTMAVVAPEERAAAAGITQLARTTGSALGPILTGSLFAAGLLHLPLLLAGGLKIAYDLLLYAQFRALVPPEEQRRLDEAIATRSLR
jgi:MFS family permease